MKSRGLSQPSLWLNNAQLSLWGTLFGLISMVAQHRGDIARDGFFRGYDTKVWLLVFTQSAGGLVVSGKLHCRVLV